MRHKNSIRNHAIAAFTLIEMAIVIVIIGLLLGAVALGQSYIQNSQLNALVTESKYYMSAFDQFQTMYRSVPGDLATASSQWSGAGNGDGNGVLSATGGAPNTNEQFFAFQHLSLAGLIEGSYNGNGPNGIIGTNIPSSSFSETTGWFFDHPTAMDGNVSGDSYYFDGFYPTVLRVGSMAFGASGMPASPFLTPAQGLKIDTKYDDGNPSTGMIMTPKSSAQANCASSDVAGSAVYNATNPAKTCTLIFKVQ